MEYLHRLLQWLIQISRAAYRWLTGQPSEQTTAPETLQAVAEPELQLTTADLPRYAKKRSLLTRPETELFERLQREIGAEYQLFAKVRLGDVMYLHNLPADRKFHNNQIQCKHFDFVLCHRRSHEPLLAIELNDDSHTRFNRIQSDEFKSKVCQEIGLPILWLKVGVNYRPGELANQIRTALSPPVPPSPTG